jgi:aryl-alcohol dehydrogenase-like predicted oxidoreductase
MTMEVVEAAVDLSRARLGVDRIDLLQFHWWMYEHPGYLDALRHLDTLRQVPLLVHHRDYNRDEVLNEAPRHAAAAREDLASYHPLITLLIWFAAWCIKRHAGWQRGKIRHLALTNFDTAHLAVVLAQVPRPAHGVQYPATVAIPCGGLRVHPERKLHRVGPNCETWPNTLTGNPY